MMCEVRKSALMVFCATLLLLAGALLPALPASALGEDKRIAVVNVSNVFQAYAKVKDVQDKLQAEYDPQQKELQAQERSMKTWEDRLRLGDGRDEADPELFKEKLKFEQATFDYKLKLRKLLIEVEERRKNEMKTVLNEIKNAIRIMGVREKYDLVLRAPEFGGEFDPDKADKKKDPEDEKMTAAELVRRFRENPVLYFSTGVDITDKVIDLLNSDYRAGSPKSATLK
jgi:Skp family chaperone for outer membrane proteins